MLLIDAARSLVAFEAAGSELAGAAAGVIGAASADGASADGVPASLVLEPSAEAVDGLFVIAADEVAADDEAVAGALRIGLATFVDR